MCSSASQETSRDAKRKAVRAPVPAAVEKKELAIKKPPVAAKLDLLSREGILKAKATGQISKAQAINLLAIEGGIEPVLSNKEILELLGSGFITRERSAELLEANVKRIRVPQLPKGPGAADKAKDFGLSLIPIVGTARELNRLIKDWDKLSTKEKITGITFTSLSALGDVVIAGTALKISVKAVKGAKLVQSISVSEGSEAAGIIKATRQTTGKTPDLVFRGSASQQDTRAVVKAFDDLIADTPSLKGTKNITIEATADKASIQALLRTDDALQPALKARKASIASELKDLEVQINRAGDSPAAQVLVRKRLELFNQGEALGQVDAKLRSVIQVERRLLTESSPTVSLATERARAARLQEELNSINRKISSTSDDLTVRSLERQRNTIFDNKAAADKEVRRLVKRRQFTESSTASSLATEEAKAVRLQEEINSINQKLTTATDDLTIRSLQGQRLTIVKNKAKVDKEIRLLKGVLLRDERKNVQELADQLAEGKVSRLVVRTIIRPKVDTEDVSGLARQLASERGAGQTADEVAKELTAALAVDSAKDVKRTSGLLTKALERKGITVTKESVELRKVKKLGKGTPDIKEVVLEPPAPKGVPKPPTGDGGVAVKAPPRTGSGTKLQRTVRTSEGRFTIAVAPGGGFLVDARDIPAELLPADLPSITPGKVPGEEAPGVTPEVPGEAPAVTPELPGEEPGVTPTEAGQLVTPVPTPTQLKIPKPIPETQPRPLRVPSKTEGHAFKDIQPTNIGSVIT